MTVTRVVLQDMMPTTSRSATDHDPSSGGLTTSYDGTAQALCSHRSVVLYVRHERPGHQVARLREYADSQDWRVQTEFVDRCPPHRDAAERPQWEQAARLLDSGAVCALLAPDEGQLVFRSGERVPLRLWLLGLGVCVHYLRSEVPVHAGAEAVRCVAERVLSADAAPPDQRDWTVLRDGLRLLVAEVRFVAGRGDPAALAVGEARRKLAYAPPFPDRRYAEKLARCVQALLRHTV